MAPSFDYAGTPSLLCAEDDDSLTCSDDSDDYGGVTDEFQQGGWNQNHNFMHNEDFFFTGFALYSEEILGLMVEKEVQHLPRYDYLNRFHTGDLDLSMRMEAVDWIFKVHAYYNFGPLSAYLSINYLDRFLSLYDLPKGKVWMMQLLSVACLSLAAKMEETEVPLSLDLQVGVSKFLFEATTIQKMELLVMSTLNWRLQAVTPFSFIDYFLWKFNDDESPPRLSISRSIELILNTLKGVDYLNFRPSEIAAAVAISVLGEIGTVDIDSTTTFLIQHVQKENVLKCIEMIQGASVKGVSITPTASVGACVPQSPIGVLDAAACLSYKSDEITVGSCPNSSHSSPEAKRRKLNQLPQVDLDKS